MIQRRTPMMPEHDPEFLKVVAWAQEQFEVDRWLITADKLEERHPQRAAVLRKLLTLPYRELPMRRPTFIDFNSTLPWQRADADIVFGGRVRLRNWMVEHCGRAVHRANWFVQLYWLMQDDNYVRTVSQPEDWEAMRVEQPPSWLFRAGRCERCRQTIWWADEPEVGTVTAHLEEVRMRQCLWIAGVTDVIPRRDDWVRRLWTVGLVEELLGNPIRWPVDGIAKAMTTRFMDGTCVRTDGSSWLLPLDVWQEERNVHGPVGPP